MTSNGYDALTPLQQQIMEVLGARARLWERIWTFPTSQAMTKTLSTLTVAGLVDVYAGIVESTVRASLTQRGRETVIPGVWVPKESALRAAGQQSVLDVAAALPGNAAGIGVPQEYVPRIARWIEEQAAALE